jgi:glycosyltransferase involved in cell wall biosynthesis
MTIPVSVVIPTYNQSKLLTETVDSILSQRYEPAEVVILDDGSTDDTKQVVARMSAKVKYVYKTNGGICSARNAGVASAQSAFIAFCDHDDLWREDKLEQQMELHQQMPTLNYSFTNYAVVSDGVWAKETKFDGAPAGFFDSSFVPLGRNLVCESSLYLKLLKFQPIFPSTVVMKKELYESLGGANEKFGKNPAEDRNLTLQCVHIPPLGVVTDPVVGIRKHATNYSGNLLRNALGEIDILNHALETHPIGDTERAAIRERLEVIRKDASYDAFATSNFAQCKEFLSAVPRDHLDSQMRMKLLISSLPQPLAKTIHSLIVKK